MPGPGMLDIYRQRHEYDRDRKMLDNSLKKSKSSKIGGKVAAGLAVTAIGGGIAGAKQSFDKKKAADLAKNAISKSRGDASELARRTADVNKSKLANSTDLAKRIEGYTKYNKPNPVAKPSTPVSKPNTPVSKPNIPTSTVKPSAPVSKPNIPASTVKPSTPVSAPVAKPNVPTSTSVDKPSSSSMMDHVRDYGGALKDTAKRAVNSTIHDPKTRLAVGGTAALVGAGLAARKYLKKK